MNLSDFNYNLPDELIAQVPLEQRDQSRLMVVNTQDQSIKHYQFPDLVSFLKKGDVLVFNNSKVIPARLFAHKKSGGRVEIFLVRQIGSDRWTALLKGLKSFDVGRTLIIADGFEALPVLKDGEVWEVRFNLSGASLYDAIHTYGITPLPPYIKKTADLTRYQTVYADVEGSVAAPTAGLHFTESLLETLRRQGVETHYVTLHVGPGTFSPIRHENILEHTMHSEWASVCDETAQAISEAKRQGRRIIAVGTTSVRSLESFSSDDGVLESGEKDISLFIYPGYRFKMIDAMVTNFHLPQSSLLILVSAFAEYKKQGGKDLIFRAYSEAVEQRYRFFSFGDAMFIF